MSHILIGSRHTRLEWVPTDACTLPTPEQPLRAAAFDRLFDEALVEAEMVTVTGEERGRLTFAGEGSLVGRVRELVDTETSCCSFFNFHVSEQSRRASDGNRPTARRVGVDVPSRPAAGTSFRP